MKLQPHVWTQLADSNAVRIPGEKRHSLRPNDSAGAGNSCAAAGAGTPSTTVAPPAIARPLRSSVALPVLAVALSAAWLAAEHSAHAQRGLLAAIGVALVLLLPITLGVWRHARAVAAEAVAARRQLVNILDSLREGLFFIGRDLRLSATCSASMNELLRLSAPAGRRFEDVLQPLLDEETLAAALTFLQLLWNDEADDHAIESLNPLSQVAVSFANSGGGCERRYLSFSFRRVAGSLPADDCILGVVADVTDRVLLARELEQAHADGDSPAELLLQLVRADPVALVAFLDDADTAFRKTNAILTASGIGQQHLRQKLMAVLQELHAVTAEAEALPFAGFAQRLQSIDDLLSALCAKASLTGNDFLPVVVRLDELMSHAATMRAIHQRIVLLRPASAGLAALDLRDPTISTGPKVLDPS